MIKTNQKNDIDENGNSLITRAGQIMALIIGLGLVSMISSMLVAESLSGDAEKINRSGQLRMLAVKVSRAALLDEKVNPHTSQYLLTAKEDFEKAFRQLFVGGLTHQLDEPAISSQYQKVAKIWDKIKSISFTPAIDEFDGFVVEIDQLVLLIQQESESKISVLRAIHGISLLTIILIAFVVLRRINRNIVSPLKRLVTVAYAAGKGDFSLRADYDQKNELGVLSKTINKMSKELKLTHEDFEKRVRMKTSALSRSNNILAVLFDSSKLLAEQDIKEAIAQITSELQETLGFGEVVVEFTTSEVENVIFDTATGSRVKHNICFEQQKFLISKRSKKYGCLIWNYQAEFRVEDWQINLLKTISDMLASAYTHELERVAENRLVIIEERAVIARELHDSLAQSLSYLKIQVALLTKKMNKELSREQIDSTVEDIHLGLNRAYLQLRELLTTFRLKLEDPSLKNALAGTVIEFSSKSSHEIKLNFDLKNKSLSANQEIHILQIVREALSNVRRHAEATFAKVCIGFEQGHFILTIEDNGIGMKKEHQLEGHFGLGIMRERAKSLNAKINIKSSIDKGTIIEVTFPE